MTDIVFLNNQDKTKAITITNSLLVAEKFEKPHNDVLKSIRKLLVELDEGKISHTYYCKETTYTDSQNRQKPMFEFNRDFLTNEENIKVQYWEKFIKDLALSEDWHKLSTHECYHKVKDYLLENNIL